MGNYCELVIRANEPLQDILIAELSEIGYDGFDQEEDTLRAYIDEASFSKPDLDIVLNTHGLSYSKSIIKKQNWNSLWESNFEPVQVDEFVGIRASFHPPFKGVEHEIVITPKMSFGTGHHATTHLMMRLMQDLDFKGKSVFDFGCGTGILAILAERLGAVAVLAADNDDWCIENASENSLINGCNRIDIQRIDKAVSERVFDIVLANINKHIILENLPVLAGSLAKGGQLLLSGLLTVDETDIIDACNALQLTHFRTAERNGWIALWFF